MTGLRKWPELLIRYSGSRSNALFIVLFCGLLHDTSERVLIKRLCLTHSISNRETLPTEKMPAKGSATENSHWAKDP